jgi:hypothetical protein
MVYAIVHLYRYGTPTIYFLIYTYITKSLVLGTKVIYVFV